MSDDALTEFLHAAMPLCATLGVRGVRSDPELTVMEMDWAAALCTMGGVVHGGALMALADSAGAAAAFANLPDGATATSTIESKTNFVGAVTEGSVTASARVLHAGKTTIVVETEITQADRLIAKTTQTQLVI